MQPEGVIVGGWNYVIAAFGITTAGLLIYAWSLYSRARGGNDDDSS